MPAKSRKPADPQDAPIPKSHYGVHRTHCCDQHGCKYGYNKCPVVTGKVVQEHPCETCGMGSPEGGHYVTVSPGKLHWHPSVLELLLLIVKEVGVINSGHITDATFEELKYRAKQFTGGEDS